MKEFPIKFLSLRDKNASHRRSKSVPAGTKETKSRPLSAEAFRAMFKMDGSRQSSKHEAELEATKIEEIQRRLEQLNITNVSTDHVRDIMATRFADGDPTRAAEFIALEQKAQAGIVVSHDPSIALLGAENREAVTCYLDALLFAMFSKLDAFECMLSNEFPLEDPRYKLVNLLRMWVNMLRSGKLIHTDLTKLIQDALGDCGWPDARLLEQQDTSEAFVFLTETLQLPLLSLQVDLFHQGKKEKDDHKVVFERLLNLAVPPDPEGKGVKLEDCLEEYFNARVDVLRDSEEAKKSTVDDKGSDQRPGLKHHDTIRLIKDDEAATPTSMTTSPTEMPPSIAAFEDAREDTSSRLPNASGSQRRPPSRGKSTGVIRRVLVDEQGRPAGDVSSLQKARRKGSSVIKAVTIPAWQFFRLIPWHALTNTEPKNDTEVAMNFDQRPIVGICLKRYAMNESGRPQRINTFIDIPDSLRLPHFMLASGPELEEENGLSTEYKLVLQSVVCHRGDSVQSGHYIAFARVAPKLLTDNRRHNFDPPPDYEEAQWVRFDDLETKNRVVFVDDIKRSLKEEMPYLLFYQVVPMVDMTCPSTAGTETEPPSYDESKKSFEMTSSGSLCDGDLNSYGRHAGHHRDETLVAETPIQSKPPSIRLSSEAERPPRPIFDSNWTGWNTTGSTPGESRRPSVVCTDSEAVTPAITPDASSPVISPNDESTASRLSRAASRFALGRQSRSASQSGEGRLSFSMTRLGGLMKTSSAGAPNLDTPGKAPESPLEGEKSPAQPQATPSKHKRGKSKDKTKHKSNGSQPERECSIM
ncbi:ubiquitin carboxyl-terminal hydrolase [Hirsutella rhossiliensis]|uniref:ubiquitinyl hydrolase 1 n=1 Tax=Hirsutella rhossiliensis TaxID=111463 RepID=A0A9P8N1F5_9HYPO|nr:ubiquitin carboxyl-terminal hydrolase domain-containing protein [Hirsutella rhossiliensis]KAH0965094.1 ubiquitin carboxyl-terminal hydrolase domain-containing protein [Hirsutella rhossiliensis]